MYSFGGANGHNNRIAFGDLAYMDAPTAYSFCCFIIVNVGAGGHSFFSKQAAGANVGWTFSLDAAEKVYAVHREAGGTTSSTVSGTALTVGTLYHLAVTWDGSNVDYYLNGVADGTPAFSRGIDANPTAVTLGNQGTADTGSGCSLGHVMWWNVALTTQEAISLYAGMVPQPAALKFWAPGWTDAGIEIIGQASATKSNTVTIIEDAFKTNPIPGLGKQLVSVIGGTHPVYKVIAETMGLSEAVVTYLRQIQVVNETLGIEDHAGEESGYQEPDGIIYDTVTDGTKTTVWTKKFPPFVKKTAWTESS